jgi:hypothetical protein
MRVSDLPFSYDSAIQRFSATVSAFGVRDVQTVRRVPMLSDSFVVRWHEEAYDVSIDSIAYIANGYIFLHAHAYDNVTDLKTALANTSFYYPLATPVTDDCGYVDMPDIPSDATVSIPELEALGVRYFIGGEAVELAKQWYERAYTELGGMLAALTERVEQLEG